jgi:hypothetical protein
MATPSTEDQQQQDDTPSTEDQHPHLHQIGKSLPLCHLADLAHNVDAEIV